MFIALLTEIASYFNYFWNTNYELPAALSIVSLVSQAVLAAVTIFTAVRYRGKRTRKSYDGAGYKIFTVPYAIIFISILGNIVVLAVLSLYATGVVQGL